MRYTKKIIIGLMLYASLFAMGVTAAAGSAEGTYLVRTVDPVNAVIAAALVLLAGGVIFIRRHR